MGRILVIDDDDQFRTMLRQALGREGYEVVEARNGQEGSSAIAPLRQISSSPTS